MAERENAEAQLRRLLELLPRATHAGGVALAELARDLEVTESRLLADLEQVYTRAYYHSAGDGEDVQVLIDAREVRVFTTGEFRRPPRMTPHESLALALGLRILAAEATAVRRPKIVALAERLEAGALGSPPEGLVERVAVNPGADAPVGVRADLMTAARERRRCRIAYLKPRAPEPQPRTIDPYVLMVAEGRWYLVAYCHASGETRVFRADRVVGVETLGEHFSVPERFDPHDFVQEGRVFHSGEALEEVEVPVRYSARIARWIEERGPVEQQDDGSVVVRHRVVDPGWLVRHVLEHGADAVVLGPPEMRRRVAEAARRVAGSAGP